MESRNKKEVTPQKALEMMAGLCAKSEQCPYDIMAKLRKYGLTAEDAGEVLNSLRELKFVDEARYARSFARDKVRFSGWGRNKIRQQLMLKRIPAALITEALAAIEPADYKDALIRAAKAKTKSLDLTEYGDRTKLLKHLMTRGFEAELSMKMVAALIKRLNKD